MKRALHITTTVLPGGRIMVEDPELSEGDEVNVIVSLAAATTRRSAVDILANSPQKGAFEKAEDVDEYIWQERDSWHS
jgi:hypothetical protein